MSTLDATRNYAANTLLYASDFDTVIDDIEAFFNTDLADNENVNLTQISENITTAQANSAIGAVSSTGISAIISTGSALGLSNFLSKETTRKDSVLEATTGNEFEDAFTNVVTLSLTAGTWLISCSASAVIQISSATGIGASNYQVSGRVVLTASGVTGINTSNLTATEIASIDEDMPTTFNPIASTVSGRSGIKSGGLVFLGTVASSGSVTLTRELTADESGKALITAGFNPSPQTEGMTITAVRLF